MLFITRQFDIDIVRLIRQDALEYGSNDIGFGCRRVWAVVNGATTDV